MPLRAQCHSPCHLPPKEGGFPVPQEKGAEESSPCLASQFVSLPLWWVPLLTEGAPFPLPRVLMQGATLLLEKEAWPAHRASPHPAAHHHAQLPAGAPLETSGRESKNFAGLTAYMEKLGWSFWCAYLGQLHLETPAPQAPCRANSM